MKYAKNSNGEFVSISEVGSGLQSDAFCIECGEALIARKGAIKIHHFAHQADTECGGAAETQVHIEAKIKIKESQVMPLPIRLGWTSAVKEIGLKSVELEKRHKSGFTPDITAVDGNNETYWIEIKVTHGIEPEKLAYCREHNINLVEIEYEYSDGSNLEYVGSFFNGVIYLGGATAKIWNLSPFNEHYDAITAELRKEVRETNQTLKTLYKSTDIFIDKELKSFDIRTERGRENIQRIAKKAKENAAALKREIKAAELAKAQAIESNALDSRLNRLTPSQRSGLYKISCELLDIEQQQGLGKTGQELIIKRIYRIIGIKE